jgi:hypothetical protein
MIEDLGLYSSDALRVLERCNRVVLVVKSRDLPGTDPTVARIEILLFPDFQLPSPNIHFVIQRWQINCNPLTTEIVLIASGSLRDVTGALTSPAHLRNKYAAPIIRCSV